MKKTIFTLLVALFTLSMGTMHYASAQGVALGDYELDASIGPATGPGDYDSGVGINFGAGYMLRSTDKNLQARFDISFYEFKHDFPWGSGTYTRVPFTFSARYYLPIEEKLRAFGQAGLEISIDNFDTFEHESKSELNVGIAPGVGIEYFVNPRVSIFALGVAHLISDSYFSLQFGVATHF